jgi:hypothetical protein
MTSYPTTKEEWWQSLEDNWDKILPMILDYYPNQDDFPEKGWPVEIAAQAACNDIIKELREKHPIWKSKDFLKAHVTHLKDTRDSALDSILQSTWFGMPENPRVRELPGFFKFCDLCSEAHVLYREERT